MSLPGWVIPLNGIESSTLIIGLHLPIEEIIPFKIKYAYFSTIFQSSSITRYTNRVSVDNHLPVLAYRLLRPTVRVRVASTVLDPLRVSLGERTIGIQGGILFTPNL